MHIKVFRNQVLSACLAAVAALCWAALPVQAQRGQRGQGPQTARAAASADLTGYWISVVTEDWEFRMLTPPKGEFGGLGSIPINDAGRKAAESWDPAKDEAAREQCKSYGAPALMRVPGRLHVTWADDSTLKIETEAGTQTRLLHFGGSPAPGGERTWQGYSSAQWEGGTRGRGGAPSVGGSLKVVTTNLRPGYLRKNGAPYSANVGLTEYFERYSAPNGDELLVVMTIVDDPQYLSQPFVTSTNFKKLPDGSGWNPTPCMAR